MINYFSLNNKYIDMYYALLFYFTITIFHFGSNYIIWKDFPTKKELIQSLILTFSIITFYVIINPGIQVNVLNDSMNNDHITKI